MSSPLVVRWLFVSLILAHSTLLNLPYASSQTYVNRVWHYPSDAPPYYTIEDQVFHADTMWNVSAGPFVCEAHLTVATGVLWTIESGVEVQVIQEKGLYVLGALQAAGVTFTRYGSDGHWRGIYLSPTLSASNLTACTIRYAGGVGYCYNGCSGLGTYNGEKRFTSLYIDNCSPVVVDCLIEESFRNGIEIWRGQPTIQNNNIRNLGPDSYPIVLDVTDTYPILAGNVCSGTGILGISVPPGRWMNSGVWRKPGPSFPYLLNGSVAVESGTTLTLEPGVEVRAEGNIGLYVRGTLNGVGVPGDPILFTSRSPIPANGDWNGIYLGPGAGSSNLTQCQILYAGGLGLCYYGCHGLGSYHGADRFASLYIDGSNPLIAQCEIAESRTNGIETYGASPNLVEVSIHGCLQNGLRMEAASHPVITQTSFQSNGEDGYYAVTQDASSTAEPTSVGFLDNTLEGIEIRGGHAGDLTIWRSWALNLPYVITDSTFIDPSGVLVIDPGVVVKTGFSTVGLYIYGVVIADGTPEPIVFTSLHDDSVGGDTERNADDPLPARGDWLGIFLGPGADASVLNRVEMRYAGSYGRCYYGCHGWENVHGGDRFASLYIDTASPTITDCTFSESRTNGVEIWRGNPTLANNRFQNMGNDGYPLVYSTTDTYPRMNGNVSSGTGYHAVYVPGGNWKTSGCWNLPGLDFPYYIAGHVTLATDTILSISPGTMIKFGDGNGLYVIGTLVAKGSPEAPIAFTSNAPDAVREKWRGIYFGPQAGESELHFCSILYAGSWSWGSGLGYYNGAYRLTSVYLDGCSPTLACCTIGKTSHGIAMFNSAASIVNCVLTDCWSRVILCEGGSTPILLHCTMAGSTRGGAIGLASVNSSPTIESCIVAFNGAGVTQAGTGAVNHTHNCVFGNGSDWVGLSPDATDISVDPLLTGVESGDFHLTAQSPCINTADPLISPPITEDRDGHVRPVAVVPDIGAYERTLPGLAAFDLGAVWGIGNWYGLMDLDLNQVVDVQDLILFLRRWK